MRTLPRLLIFDLDGTLVDSLPGIRLGLNRALVEFGGEERDLAWVRRHVGFGARHLIAAAAAGQINPEHLLQRFRNYYSEVLTKHSPPFPKVDATLRELARDFTLAVASNKPLPWVERLVAHLRWGELLAAVAGPETAGVHKPAPPMIEAVLMRVGASAQQTMLVGDMPVDAETGANAGIPVVGVTTGSATDEELRSAGCVAVLDGVPDLPAWLSSTARGNAGCPQDS